MFCYKCGEQIAEGANFCHKCGTKVVYKNSAPLSIDTTLQQDSAMSAQTIEKELAINNNKNDFKAFVDNHVRITTKFKSADDLLMNSKPLTFIWPCVGIQFIIGLILGANSGGLAELFVALLIFGGLFGYTTVFIASGIIRTQYSAKFSGEFDNNINPDEFIIFLNEHLKYLSPYFHEFGYLECYERPNLLKVIGKLVLDTSNEINLCCEFGPKKKSLATIRIKHSMVSSNSEQMQYIVGAVRNGFMLDGRSAGFFGHVCLIKTAPILQAAIKYYLKNYKN